MPILLRLMCWNIAEGNADRRYPPNNNLQHIANEIKSQNPDIIMLNEAVVYDLALGGGWGNYIRQPKRIAELAGYPYVAWANTVMLQLSGHKCVAVISRYPIVNPMVYHPINFNNRYTGYGMGQTSTVINGIKHEIYSLRFNAWNDNENAAGHTLAQNLINNTDPKSVVIMGGDFNADSTKPHFRNFFLNSKLRDAIAEKPDPMAAEEDPIDRIFFNGEYWVLDTKLRKPWAGIEPEVSDHSWFFTELGTANSDYSVSYWSKIKFRHQITGVALHSHSIPYTHPGTSGCQQITGFAARDDNDYWVIKPPQGTVRFGNLRHGDIIQLEHASTGMIMYSQAGYLSPLSGQQEVSCYNTTNAQDTNGNWTLEVDGAGLLTLGKRFRLVHVNTRHALHSHEDFSHTTFTAGQQEVTCFSGRDDNDWWIAFEEMPSGLAPVVSPDPRLIGRGIRDRIRDFFVRIWH
jgi:hypothetical protein